MRTSSDTEQEDSSCLLDSLVPNQHSKTQMGQESSPTKKMLSL